MSERPECLSQRHPDLLARLEDGWMLRQLAQYQAELQACRSWKGR